MSNKPIMKKYNQEDAETFIYNHISEKAKSELDSISPGKDHAIYLVGYHYMHYANSLDSGLYGSTSKPSSTRYIQVHCGIDGVELTESTIDEILDADTEFTKA